MSNYIAKALNPKTNKCENAEFLDNYFGQHKYGVRFSDEKVCREEGIELCEKNWQEKLFELSEKYCKHDDKKYNSCLFHIFKPFIENVLLSAQKIHKAELKQKILGLSARIPKKNLLELLEIIK